MIDGGSQSSVSFCTISYGASHSERMREKFGHMLHCIEVGTRKSSDIAPPGI